MELIVVWFVAPDSKVLLKKKNIKGREFFVPFSAWKKRRETILGTLERIKGELEFYAPEGKHKVRFHLFLRATKDTKKGKITEFHFICKLPFYPILVDKNIVEVGKDKIKEYSSICFKEDYRILLKVLGIQSSLEDF